MNNPKQIPFSGLSLLNLIPREDRRLRKERHLTELNQVTAARLLSEVDVKPRSAVLLSGRYNKTFDLLQSMTRRSPLPYVVVGTEAELGDESCLRDLGFDWEEEYLPARLDEGNGALVLAPTADNLLCLKEYLTDWADHMVILCVGKGFQIDNDLLNKLMRHGSFVLVTESPVRCVQESGECSLSVEKLFGRMDYLIFAHVGAEAKELVKLLPVIDYEKPTNTLDFSSHRDGASPYENRHHHGGGFGLRFSQSRHMEQRPILTEGELNDRMNKGLMLVYSPPSRQGWFAKLIG